MPEYLRALAVVVCLSVPTLWLLQKPITEAAIALDDYRIRRNTWIGLTLLSFLANNFWIYVGVAALVLIVVGAKDSHRLGLYLFVLFVVPPFWQEVPGFGLVNYFVEMTHARLLALTVLLPAYLQLRARDDTPSFGSLWVDRFLLGYIMLQIALQGLVDTATNTLRFAFYSFVDVFLPYYVASRSMRSPEACRDALGSLLVAALVMAPLAAFEYLKHWLLYSPLAGTLGARFGMGNYLSRGDDLRALTSTGHSIILGYVMAIAIAFFGYTQAFLSSRRVAGALLCALLVGLYAPVSRGPWTGAAAGAAVMLLTGPNRLSRLGKIAVLGVPVAIGLAFSPMGQKFIDLLPFVGTVDDSTVVYRQRLFEVSVQVMMLHPWLGSFDYLSAPAMQEMIQGEGIIDMVNTYLSVAMSYGLVGLSLFASVFVFAAVAVLRGIWQHEAGSEMRYLGRALLAALVSALITIATVSSILIVPTVYWMLAGLCSGYGVLATRARPVPHVAHLSVGGRAA